MDAIAADRMSVAEFLTWVQTQEKPRYELIRGELVAMAGERAEHVRAKRRIANALEAAIARASLPCEAFSDGLAIVIDHETTYLPDDLVNCGAEIAAGSMIAPNPMIVVEVLSLSTRGIDVSVRLADYFRVAGLEHYLIVDLGRRHVLHHRRQPDGTIATAIVRDGDIRCDPPGLSVPAATFFE